MRPVTQTRRRADTQTTRASGVRRPARHLAALFVLNAAVGLTAVRAEAPAGAADEPFTVIKAAKVITIAGKEIDQGMIVLAGGKIHSVGRGLEYPLNATVIDAHDLVVMPGLINPRSRFGLGRVRRSGVHGGITAGDEFYPTPGVFDELLATGYTTLALVPDGDGIPGRATVMRIAGPEEQRKLVPAAYLRITGDKAAFREALERAQKEIEKVEKARQEWEKKQEELKKQEAEKKPEEQKKEEKKAAAGAEPPPPEKKPDEPPPATQPAKFEPPPIDPAYQALVDLLQKKEGVTALIELRRASDYLHFRKVLDKYDVAHAFFAGSRGQTDFPYVIERMGEEKADVLLWPMIYRAPYSAERVHLPRTLADAGCEVVFTPFDDSPREHERALGRVAELVREGWVRSTALAAVTLHPARLLGVADRLGTIEKDRDADLIFLDADPLDPTARVRLVMIAGQIVYRAEETP